MIMNINETYTFFAPGDLVTVKHNVPNKPVMWAVEKSSRTVKNSATGEYETLFLGIKCRWFNEQGDLQEAVFNTKDLTLI